MTARDDLRRAVASEFQRLDAHQFGYAHGFCADPDADPETAAFVDAAIRIVATQAADLLQATLAELQPGMPADMALAPGLGVAEQLIRRMAAPTTTQEQ